MGGEEEEVDRRPRRGFFATRSPSSSKAPPKASPRRNLQSRTRGHDPHGVPRTSSGRWVVTTGNKSEMSVGYATLYGDMNGGFNTDQGPLNKT